MDKAAITRRLSAVIKSWKRHKRDFPKKPPEGSQPHKHLDFSPVMLIFDWFQSCGRINCSFKPSSCWQLVTTATGHKYTQDKDYQKTGHDKKTHLKENLMNQILLKFRLSVHQMTLRNEKKARNERMVFTTHKRISVWEKICKSERYKNRQPDRK